MGDPYLDAGESFIITTHRISAGFARYDMMLTTRHLILVDSSSARFEPDKIPLASILSVAAGKVATGEPVITLTFTDDAGTKDQQPKNLLFNQQPGENRKRERDLWIRKLMEQIVMIRQQESPVEAEPAVKETASRLQGAPSHTIEPALPHKSVVRAEAAPVELEVVPEEPEGAAGEMTVSTTATQEVRPDAEGAGSAETGPAVFPETLTELPGEEESVPTDEKAVPAEVEDTPPCALPAGAPVDAVQPCDAAPEAVDSGTHRQAGLIERLASALQLQKKEQRPGQPEPVPSDTIPSAGSAESPPAPAAPEMPAVEPETEVSPEEIPEAQGEEPRPEEEPVVAVEAACSPETTPVSPAAGEEEFASGMISPVADAEAFRVEREIGPEFPAFSPEPPGQDIPHEPHRSPFPTVWTSIALFLILLAIAGGVLFFVQSVIGPGENPVPSTVAPAVTSPAVTGTPQIATPDSDVLVQVTCNGSFTGWVGNPGNLMHVGGRGEGIYRITDGNGLVQASFEKQDYSGAVLTVGVYRNGTRIYEEAVGAPRGSLDFIIDAQTGEFPGGIPKPTSATGLVPGEIYRY